MGRQHATVPRQGYSFKLDSANVEKVRAKYPNLSEWVDKQFENEANILDWTDEQKMVWRRWLAVQHEAVRDIASEYLPTKLYLSVSGAPDVRYYIRSYDLGEEGRVTFTLLREDGTGIVRGVQPSDLLRAD